MRSANAIELEVFSQMARRVATCKKAFKPLDPMHHNSPPPVEYNSNSIQHILCHFESVINNNNYNDCIM